MKPLISVIMPVFNGETYLKEAINSILQQNYKHFEFLIINDGSTDQSQKIIDQFSDYRMKKIIFPKNKGLIYCLNWGIREAQGKYIARMDCDDISYSDRFESQVSFMEQNPDIGICGSWIRFGKTPLKSKLLKLPLKHEQIKSELFFISPIAHPTVMMRKKTIHYYQLFYQQEYRHIEDYELWIKAINKTQFANYPRALLFYRKHPEQITITKKKEKQLTAYKIYKKFLLQFHSFSEQQIKFHCQICLKTMKKDKKTTFQIYHYLWQLMQINKKNQIYDPDCFMKSIQNIWFENCYVLSALGLWILKIYYSTKLLKPGTIPLRKKLRFYIKCLLRR
ncbi:MAG: glycosyltransferase [Spirochaetes bacterium]|nr:glycosyltransferase [Spirochaetota bacterium]